MAEKKATKKPEAKKPPAKKKVAKAVAKALPVPPEDTQPIPKPPKVGIHKITVLEKVEEELLEIFKAIGKGAKVIVSDDLFATTVRNVIIRLILGFVASRSDVQFTVKSKSALRVRSYKNAFGLPPNLHVDEGNKTE